MPGKPSLHCTLRSNDVTWLMRHQMFKTEYYGHRCYPRSEMDCEITFHLLNYNYIYSPFKRLTMHTIVPPRLSNSVAENVLGQRHPGYTRRACTGSDYGTFKLICV